MDQLSKEVKAKERKIILHILKNVNISTLLILKLFDFLTEKVISVKYNLPYPIQVLCLEYGLVNCYLTKDYKQLRLVFDSAEVSKDKKLSKSPYCTLVDLLIDNEYYHSLKFTTVDMNKFIIINLKIPTKFVSDIKNYISINKYTKVSDEFKEAMRFKQSFVPIADNENELATYICRVNLPYRLITNHTKLNEIKYEALRSDHIVVKDIKEEALENDIKNSSLTIKFKPSKEIYNHFNFREYAGKTNKRRYS